MEALDVLVYHFHFVWCVAQLFPVSSLVSYCDNSGFAPFCNPSCIVDFAGWQFGVISMICDFIFHSQWIMVIWICTLIRERCKKKKLKKKLTSVSFMYVCVAENGERLFFFSFFFPNNSLIDNSLSE